MVYMFIAIIISVLLLIYKLEFIFSFVSIWLCDFKNFAEFLPDIRVFYFDREITCIFLSAFSPGTLKSPFEVSAFGCF